MTPLELTNPYAALHGRKRIFGHGMGERLPAGHVVERARATQTRLIEVVSDYIADAIDTRLQQINSPEERGSRMEYAAGDLVLVHRKKAIQGDKLSRIWDGPYEVVGHGSSGTASYLLRSCLDSKHSEEHHDECKLFLYRDMRDVVRTAKAGTGYKDVDEILGHTGRAKTGRNAYAFRVRYERPFRHERFDEDLSWKDVNKTEAYKKYREDNARARLPPSTQGPQM